MKTGERRVVGLMTGLLGVFGCTHAAAGPADVGPRQRALNPATNGRAGADESESLATVMVTAEKRAENLQEVPASITAISADELQSRHIDNLDDISRVVP